LAVRGNQAEGREAVGSPVHIAEKLNTQRTGKDKTAKKRKSSKWKKRRQILLRIQKRVADGS